MENYYTVAGRSRIQIFDFVGGRVPPGPHDGGGLWQHDCQTGGRRSGTYFFGKVATNVFVNFWCARKDP